MAKIRPRRCVGLCAAAVLVLNMLWSQGALLSRAGFCTGAAQWRHRSGGYRTATTVVSRAAGDSKTAFNDIRLHLYDHCPFCTRVELALGWKKMPYERELYGYADVDGPTKLTGKKMLPVLEWQDESGEKKLMPESADIVNALDKEESIISPRSGREDLAAWHEKFGLHLKELTRPRIIKMPIVDFATDEDAQYYKNKHIGRGFDFEQALEETESHLPEMEAALREFEPLLLGKNSLNENGWSWDDLEVLPSFRALTCVKELTWPEKTLKYVKEAHAAAGVALYSDDAC